MDRVDELEYILAGVMHFVDKWLEGDEFEQDEVNRAITAREKALRAIDERDEEIKFLLNRIDELTELLNDPSRISSSSYYSLGKL